MSGEAVALELGSLRDQIAARVQERQNRRNRQITIPVPGLEDLLAVSYKRLSFEEKAPLMGRYQEVMLDPASNVAEAVDAAADCLVKACQDVLIADGENEDGSVKYRSLGQRWSTSLIADLFKEDFPSDLPVHAALAAALDHEDLTEHFNRYVAETSALLAQSAEGLPGE